MHVNDSNSYVEIVCVAGNEVALGLRPMAFRFLGTPTYAQGDVWPAVKARPERRATHSATCPYPHTTRRRGQTHAIFRTDARSITYGH